MSGKPSTTGVPSGNTPVFENIIPGVSQVVAIGATSTRSTAFQPTTTIIRMVANQDCFVALGAAPTALADGTCMVVQGGAETYIGVTPGQKLAVIQSTAGGSLYITEGA